MYIYQLCVPLFKNAKLQFFQQKYIVLFKTSYIYIKPVIYNIYMFLKFT